MSQAMSSAVLESPAVTHSVQVAGWLRLDLSGEPDVVERLLRGPSPGLVSAVGGTEPHARVHVVACEPREPRWPDDALTQSVVEWYAPSGGRAKMQCADATLSWSGAADDMLQAELRLDPDDGAAFTTALKLLAVLLGVVHRRCLLVHASAVLVDGSAVLLLGDSGAGKSTTAERLEVEGLTRIADDAVFVEVADEPRVLPYFGDPAFEMSDAMVSGFPLRRALRVAKGARVSRVDATPCRSMRFWFASLMVPAGPPAYAAALFELVAELARRQVDTLAAAPSGPLLPALATSG